MKRLVSRVGFLTLLLLCSLGMAAHAQDTGLSFFYGGSASFTSSKAADAGANAERTTVLAANPSVLFELSDRLFVGGQAFITDNGEVSDFAFDPQALYLLGGSGTIPYVQGGLQDITGDVSYGGAVGILAPYGGVYIDAALFYRRLQGDESDGDVIGISLGFRLKS